MDRNQQKRPETNITQQKQTETNRTEQGGGGRFWKDW